MLMSQVGEDGDLKQPFVFLLYNMSCFLKCSYGKTIFLNGIGAQKTN